MRLHGILGSAGIFAGITCTAIGAINVNVPILPRKAIADGHITAAEIDSAASTSMTLIGGIDIPKAPTTVYSFVGENGLYVAFECGDKNPDKAIVNTTRENGPVFADDSVQLFITPKKDGTKTNYFHFAVNAAGTKYSNNMSNDQPVAGWQAAVSKSVTGWEAEMLIPLAAIGGSTDQPFWRANFAREKPARPGEVEETSAWMNPGTTLHNYRRFGFLKLENTPFPELNKLVDDKAARRARGLEMLTSGALAISQGHMQIVTSSSIPLSAPEK